MMTSRRRVLRGSLIVTVALASLTFDCTAEAPKAPQVVVVAKHPIVAPTDLCPAIDPPPAEPSKNVPTLAQAAQRTIDRRVEALASELATMWTRNPVELVKVIEEAATADPKSPSVTLLLAIAHAETNGKILDVSEAGAVGLAQATPIACRQEELNGKLFVTADYLIGSRAYITKKALGDADTIASLVLAKDNPKTRARAKRLLASAFELRREGVDELALLEPYATPAYAQKIEAADEHNLARLRELKKLLDRHDKKALRRYRDTVREEYRTLKATQVSAWKRYMDDLIAERDRMLANHFGKSAEHVKKEMPYEAGEYLADELDERFSARRMAAFLVRHLEHKAEQARALSNSDDPDRVERMTAALYNGGSHNVKRMLAGLIASLPETQQYMRKVPATRKRLDHAVASLELPATPRQRVLAR